MKAAVINILQNYSQINDEYINDVAVDNIVSWLSSDEMLLSENDIDINNEECCKMIASYHNILRYLNEVGKLVA